MTQTPPQILVVDDDPLNRMMLVYGVEQEGYAASQAEDGLQALEMLRSDPFDLVLLDVVMPELDGYQVLAEMKADETLREIPVIMVSASDEVESVVRCIELGAEDYLPKPFEPVLLHARV